MVIRPWVRLPSEWIDNHGLAQLSWKSGGEGADNTAALMVLTTIAHAADQERGEARLTYDDICAVTGLSRAKIANGLAILKRIAVIEDGASRSMHRLANYAAGHHWAMLPAKSMYSPAGRINAFTGLQLRRTVELDALKLFFLFVARRTRNTNLANIGYDKIELYTTIGRNRIKTATSFLTALSLIYVECVPSTTNERGVANAYRILGLDSYNHLGTRGRTLQGTDIDDPANQGTTPSLVRKVDYTPFLR
jgi:hypothetical protein